MQVSKKERRRLREIQKRKTASRRRHDEECFFGAFRGASRHLLPHFPHPSDVDAFRGAVESTCEAAGVRPGSSDAWCLLADILEEEDASLDEILGVVHQWMRLHASDPRPHVYRVRNLLAWGLAGRAERAMEEALASSAGGTLREVFRRAFKNAGVNFDAFEKRMRSSPPPSLPPPLPAGRVGARSRIDGRKLSERQQIRRRAQSEPPPLPPSGSSGAGAGAPIHPAPAKVSFTTEIDPIILTRLWQGPHDPLAALDLVRRGAEILAVDRFDRLLSLSTIRGVDHLSYQVETVLRVLKRFRGRVLLADEVGLGKTIEACMVLKEYMIRGQVRRALVLVPPALVGQWKSELEEKFSIPALTTQDASFRKDPEAFWSAGQVLVASLALARSAAHCASLARHEFDLVIVDEAHHLKNRATRGWAVVNALRSRFFLMLTATPVETNLNELFSLVTLLRPGTLGTEEEFRLRFVGSGKSAEPRDPEKLRELLREVMIRNTRARSGVLLPPRTARTLIVHPTAGEESLYRVVLEAARRCEDGDRMKHRTLFRQLLEEAGSSPLAVSATASRVERDGADAALLQDLARVEEAARAVETTAKLDRLVDLLPGGKVLVFSRFRATLEHVAREISQRGIAFRTFHGGMAAVEKDLAVEEFAQPGVDVLLCSEVGGEGRNLQFCHRLINFDLPWNPMKIEQRIGRIHRIGQKEVVEVTNLACAGTAEEKILEVLDRRLNLFELVVGEMDLVLGEVEKERDFDEQVFDILARSGSDEEVEAGFNQLAEKLLEARGKLERTKALDEALFGEDYEA